LNNNQYLDIFKQKIKEYNLTLSQISEFTDISQGKLKDILSGKRRLKAPVLISLCYLLGLNMEEILRAVETSRKEV